MSDQDWTAPGAGSGRPGQGPYAGRPGPAHPAPPPAGHPGYPPPRPLHLDFRPGIIPLRPLTMNDLFGGVIRAVRGNVAATVGLAALTSLVFLVPFTALGAWVSSQEESVSLEESVTSGSAGIVGQLGSTLPSIGSYFSTILLAGFLAYVIGQAVLGRKVSAGETWRGTIRRIWPLVGATLLTLLVLLVAMGAVLVIPIALLVAGEASGSGGTSGAGIAMLVVGVLLAIPLVLFLWTRLAFVTPSVILENLGVGRAFARSWQLTAKGFWRLFGIRLLTAFILSIVGSIITAPLAILAGVLLFTGLPLDQVYIWQAVLSGVTGLVAGAITTPVTAGIDALLYVDHRIRREGLDVHLVQTAQGTAAPPWPRADA